MSSRSIVSFTRRVLTSARSEVVDLEEYDPIGVVVGYEVKGLVSERYVDCIEEGLAGHYTETIGEVDQLGGSERHVLKRDTDQVVLELHAVVLLHDVEVHVDKIEDVI